MTARLGGRTIRTLITSLEVLSDDEKQVLMLDRQEDGSIVIRTRLAYESTWSASGPRFEVTDKDARMLGLLLQSGDAQYYGTALDEIPAIDFTREKPREVIEAELQGKSGDCTELDIERAKAANIAEEKANLILQMEIDHNNFRHDDGYTDGCPMCEKRIRPGYGDGSLRPTAIEATDDAIVEHPLDDAPDELPY